MGRHLCRPRRYATDTHGFRSFTRSIDRCCASEQFSKIPEKKNNIERRSADTQLPDAISTRGRSVENFYLGQFKEQEARDDNGFSSIRQRRFSTLSTRYPTDLSFRVLDAEKSLAAGENRFFFSCPTAPDYFFKEISSRYFGENRSTIGDDEPPRRDPVYSGTFFQYPAHPLLLERIRISQIANRVESWAVSRE